MDAFLKRFEKHKTAVGVIIGAILVMFCKLTGTDIPGFQMPDDPVALAKLILGGAAGLLTLIGLSDKIAKARTNQAKDELLKRIPALRAADKFLDDTEHKD